MYDRSTFSLWTQKGVAIAGPLKGSRLKRYPSVRTTWGQWLERYPRTLAMTPPAAGRRAEVR